MSLQHDTMPTALGFTVVTKVPLPGLHGTLNFCGLRSQLIFLSDIFSIVIVFLIGCKYRVGWVVRVLEGLVHYTLH